MRSYNVIQPLVAVSDLRISSLMGKPRLNEQPGQDPNAQRFVVVYPFGGFRFANFKFYGEANTAGLTDSFIICHIWNHANVSIEINRSPIRLQSLTACRIRSKFGLGTG
jgi:hypothetical protein